MIRHLLRLVWNRKRANALIIAEILLSFLVVFFVAVLGVSSWIDYRKPSGFSWDGVWYMELSAGNERGWLTEQIPVLQGVLRELALMEEVQSVTASNGLPFDGNTSIYGGKTEHGEGIEAQHVIVTPGYRDVFDIEVVDGRWFEESDHALAYSSVVVDRDFARALYGDDDPLGRTVPMGSFKDERRIVGVIDEFRKSGELGRIEQPNFFFELYDRDGALDARHGDDHRPRVFLTGFALRLSPGVGPDFEEELVARVSALAPSWTVETRTLERIRRHELRLRLAPLVAASIVAGFLMLMVGLGLVGVLWQNVTRRTRELGLRRAVGAHRGNVHRQILLELLLITTIGVGLGTLIVVQLPLLALWSFLTPTVMLVGLAAALVLIYLLATLCGLYPSWMATRIQPAEALHYE